MTDYLRIVAATTMQWSPLPRIGGVGMNSGIQTYNEQQKLSEWAEKVARCRDSGLSVRQWCDANGVNVSTFYKWQRKIYGFTQSQQEFRFTEVTPDDSVVISYSFAAIIRIGTVEASIHNGADPVTLENVFRLLKLC